MEGIPDQIETKEEDTNDPISRMRHAKALLQEHAKVVGAVKTAGGLETLTRYVEEYPSGRYANIIVRGFEDYVKGIDSEPGEYNTTGFWNFTADNLRLVQDELGEEQFQKLLKGE